MAVEQRSPESYRELRLEGFGLLLAAAVLAAVVGAAFFLGRWSERSSQGTTPAAGSPDPLAAVTPAEPALAGRSESYFDRPEGPGKQREPQREVPAPAPPRAVAPPPPQTEQAAVPDGESPPPPAASDEPAREARPGDFQIQVFAGRDRQAAEEISARLRQEGYRVQSLVEQEGAGELIKVRVGAYASPDEARRVAQELQQRGYPGSWVIRVE